MNPANPDNPVQRTRNLSVNRIGMGKRLHIRFLDNGRHGEGFENSPALQRWELGSVKNKVPQGTEGMSAQSQGSFVPCGTHPLWPRRFPAMNGWAIFSQSRGVPDAWQSFQGVLKGFLSIGEAFLITWKTFLSTWGTFLSAWKAFLSTWGTFLSTWKAFLVIRKPS